MGAGLLHDLLQILRDRERQRIFHAGILESAGERRMKIGV
jgi:hypothetical protein